MTAPQPATPRTDALIPPAWHGNANAEWEHYEALAALSRQLERDRARLYRSLVDVMREVEALDDFKLSRDLQPYRDEDVWNDAMSRANALIEELEPK